MARHSQSLVACQSKIRGCNNGETAKNTKQHLQLHPHSRPASISTSCPRTPARLAEDGAEQQTHAFRCFAKPACAAPRLLEEIRVFLTDPHAEWQILRRCRLRYENALCIIYDALSRLIPRPSYHGCTLQHSPHALVRTAVRVS